MTGAAAAAEAIEAGRELGADLGHHTSRPLTAELVTHADFLVAMTHAHRQTLEDLVAPLGVGPRLVSPNGEDIADPIGCDREVYRQCARQILGYVGRLLPEVVPA
jgi:protein-tyrosine phosphatase